MKKKGLLVLSVIAFFLSACGANQTADVAINRDTQNNVQVIIETDANVNVPDAEGETEATPPLELNQEAVNNGDTQNDVQVIIETDANVSAPDAEGETEATSPSELDQENNKTVKWVTPIALEATIYGTCDSGLVMAEEWQIQENASEAEDFSLGMLIMMLSAVEEGLTTWNASEDQAAIKDMMFQDHASVSSIFVDLANHETTTDNVVPLFRELCPQVKENAQLVIDTAIEDGLTQDVLEEIWVEEFTEYFGYE